MRTRRNIPLLCGVVVLAGCAAMVWAVWCRSRPLAPTTAEEVYSAVTQLDPAQLTDAEREKWARRVGSAFDRLPPHEFEKLVQKVISDEAWHERFRALDPEQRRRMAEQISEEKQLEMLRQVLVVLKAMPPAARKALVQQARGRMRPQAGMPDITRERIAKRIASSTPTRRAEFIRSLRELRTMAEEAAAEQ